MKRERTGVATQPDFATMPFAYPRIPDSIKPPFANAILERFADVCFGVDDPYPVARVERDGKEHGVGVRLASEEDEGVFTRV